MAEKVLQALTKKFADKVLHTDSQHGDEIAVVDAGALVEIATWLKDDPAMSFEVGVFVTCIDRLGLGEEPRYEVCFQLRSITHGHRLRLKVQLEHAEKLICPSLAGLWPSFNWQERETYDMYGIEFGSHPDLRRIYMYEEFVGHPLRKDYPKDKRQPLVRRDWSD